MASKNKQSGVSANLKRIIESWLETRKRGGKISRNTIAIGLVLLDKLRQSPILSKEDVFSPGGEIKGSRSGLGVVLKKYGLSEKFLKEATTRQAHQDGKILIEELKYGAILQTDLTQRDTQLSEGLDLLVAEANKWLSRQPIKINCDRQLSPTSWISSIFEKARGRSGGKVEQHLVGAKLKTRHKDIDIPNHPGHAGDLQTKRSGDFPLDRLSYHVTATDGKEAISRCKENLQSGVHPVLLVPRASLEKAKLRAEVEGIAGRIDVLAIEDFLAHNILELATDRNEEFFVTFEQLFKNTTGV